MDSGAIATTGDGSHGIFGQGVGGGSGDAGYAGLIVSMGGTGSAGGNGGVVDITKVVRFRLPAATPMRPWPRASAAGAASLQSQLVRA